MERKEHFKMYKSGKLWVYAAITTLSLAMGMAVNTNSHVYADTNNQVTTTGTPTVVSSSANTDSTSVASSSAVVSSAIPASAVADSASAATSSATVENSSTVSSSSVASGQENTGSAAMDGGHDAAKPATQPQHAASTRRIMVDGETTPLATQTVHFVRNGITNPNGSVSWDKWTVSDDGSNVWPEYVVPARDGYVPTVNGKMVDTIAQAPATSPDNTGMDVSMDVTIKYLQLHEEATRTRTITITDPDGKKTTQHQAVKFSRDFNKETGTYGDWQPDVKDETTWGKTAVPALKGYIAIANGQAIQEVPAQTLKGDEEDQKIAVSYLPLQTGDSQKIVTRTITLVEPGGNKVVAKQTATLQQMVAKDGDKVVAEQWTNGKWDQYQLPEIAGYVAKGSDNQTVTTIDAADINTDTQDANVTVTYVIADYNKDIDSNLSGNWAYLDGYQITNNTIHVTGWHATAQSLGRNNHYLILYDATTHREIARELIETLNRPDVLKAESGVLNADKSGFNTYFDISRKAIPAGIHLSHNLQIISRYTSSSDGNSDYTDYWFPTKQFFNLNAANHAYLDKAEVVNGRVHVAGWHATDISKTVNNHFLILRDDTKNQEVASVLLTKFVSRPDVAKVYPNIKTAINSGFDATFGQVMLTPSDHYSLISRYSTNANGNGDGGATADYRMPINNLFNINTTNTGYLDSVVVNNGSVTVSGWNATDYSLLANNHYLILFDTTANRQVAQAKVNNTARPDVARAYRNLQTAGNSGFSATFNQVDLQPGHTYALVSRYSISSKGNGDDGNGRDHVDYWFNNALHLKDSDYHAYSVDTFVPDPKTNAIHVVGWMATDASKIMPNAYLILVDNHGAEYGREKVNKLIDRPDVAKAVPAIYNSGVSGFDAQINLNSKYQLKDLVGKNLHLVLRFTSSSDGNGDYSDQYSSDHIITEDQLKHI